MRFETTYRLEEHILGVKWDDLPKTADEAQYNIAYPVATAIVHGDFGIDRVLQTAILSVILGDENLRVRELVDTVNREILIKK